MSQSAVSILRQAQDKERMAQSAKPGPPRRSLGEGGSFGSGFFIHFWKTNLRMATLSKIPMLAMVTTADDPP